MATHSIYPDWITLHIPHSYYTYTFWFVKTTCCSLICTFEFRFFLDFCLSMKKTIVNIIWVLYYLTNLWISFLPTDLVTQAFILYPGIQGPRFCPDWRSVNPWPKFYMNEPLFFVDWNIFKFFCQLIKISRHWTASTSAWKMITWSS